MTKKDKYVICEVCGAKVKKSNLKRHISRVHEREKKVPQGGGGVGKDIEKQIAANARRRIMPMAITLIISVIILLIYLYYPFPQKQTSLDTENTWRETIPVLKNGVNTFITSDGWKIYGYFHKGNTSLPAVLFLHGMMETRAVWSPILTNIQDLGFSTYAIDLRGHGDSVYHNGRKECVRDGTISEYEISMMSVDANTAIKALKKTGIRSVVIIGASIGANVALVTSENNAYIKGVVLLSPGLNYHNIYTETASKKYGTRPIIIATAKGDDYAYTSSIQIASNIGDNVVTYYFDGTDHGTNLLRHEELKNGIISWLNENFV